MIPEFRNIIKCEEPDAIDWDGDSTDDELPMIVCENNDVENFMFNRDEVCEVDEDAGIYWRDPDFPPYKALGCRKEGVEWKRPHEICDNPKMFVDGGDQLDICQGSLGDCWFLAAAATMSMHPDLLKRVCPDQTFDPNNGYTGKFSFKFYQYGKWVTVTIDDRLPTMHNQLIYVHSATKNEFWAALLEKAYAKLNGNYENLEGGHSTEAMVDLTGGSVEYIEKIDEMEDDDLYKLVKTAICEQGALLTAAIQAKSRAEMEAKRSDGLICGHAYSITKVARFRMSDDKEGSKIYQLIRLRNPWGACEWNGPFSDSDPRWGAAGADGDFSKENDENGEFWMPFADFARIFTKIELCRLKITDIAVDGRWYQDESMRKHGQWSNDTNTAGGCANFETFTQNPFMKVQVAGGKDADEILISLQQKHRRKQKSAGVPFLNMGFTVYKIDEEKLSDNLADMVDRRTRPVTSSVYTARRDLTKKIKLPGDGTYLIVPTTFHPDKIGKFYMQSYVERPNYNHDEFENQFYSA